MDRSPIHIYARMNSGAIFQEAGRGRKLESDQQYLRCSMASRCRPEHHDDYAGTIHGIVKSTDCDVRWKRPEQAVLSIGTSIRRVIDPLTPSTLYDRLRGENFKSVGLGRSWNVMALLTV